ncbi:hypothetical protein BC828DRAFT_409941 [Blastocladiella britannica]|nr:hypothetical protein BC828DRAFT_409941 [Blastocladiella britannica]
MAAAEGQLAVLEFLVAEMIIDPRSFTAYLSLETPTEYFLKSLIQLSADDHVLPTWRWLANHGYMYPMATHGALTIFVSHAAEYATVRALFLESDFPRFAAIADHDLRARQFQFIAGALRHWFVKGHRDLLPVLAELRVLMPRYLHELMVHGSKSEHWDELLLAIEAVCSSIEGGLDAVLEYGLEKQSHDRRSAILLMYQLRPESFTATMLNRYDQSGFVDELLAVPQVQDKVDYAPLVTRVLKKLRTSSPSPAVAARTAREISNIGLILHRGLSDTGALGAATWAAVREFTSAQRLLLFGVLVAWLPTESVVVASEPTTSSGDGGNWTTGQQILDRVLPESLADSAADLAESANLQLQMACGARTWMGASSIPRTESDPWTSDPPTAIAATALTIGPSKVLTHEEQRQMWVTARLALLAPASVLAASPVFSAATPAWMWQLRLDAMRNGTPMSGRWRRRLGDWPAMVAKALDQGRSVAAALMLHVVAVDPAADRSEACIEALRGIAESRPEIMEMANAAGLAIGK